MLNTAFFGGWGVGGIKNHLNKWKAFKWIMGLWSRNHGTKQMFNIQLLMPKKLTLFHFRCHSDTRAALLNCCLATSFSVLNCTSRTVWIMAITLFQHVVWFRVPAASFSKRDVCFTNHKPLMKTLKFQSTSLCTKPLQGEDYDALYLKNWYEYIFITLMNISWIEHLWTLCSGASLQINFAGFAQKLAWEVACVHQRWY